MGLAGHVSRGSFPHRRALFYIVCFTFIVGAAAGGAAVARLHDDDAVALATDVARLFGRFSGGPTAGSGVMISDEPAGFVPVSTVLTDAFTGDGGIAPLLGIMVLLGLSVIGVPIVLLLIFWRGFTIGFAVTFFVQRFLWRGFILAFATFVPHNVFVIPAVIIAGMAAIGLSSQTFALLFGKNVGTMQSQMLRAASMLLASALLLIGGSLVEAYVTPGFMNTTARWLLGE